MKRKLLLILSVSTVLAAAAQSLPEGAGKLVIIQSDEVESLLKSKHSERAALRARQAEEAEAAARNESQATANNNRRTGPKRRYNSAGFRIQVFTGGNSRADKQAAQAAEKKVRAAFPELATYVHFFSPHWVCRVGDFQKREDAQKYLSKIRAKGLEARIIRSNIIVAK